MVSRLIRQSFFLLVVRPIVFVLLGVNIRHRERLPSSGPALIVANHNSHLDTLVLITLFPMRLLPRIRPVAAEDYFLRNRVLAWFSLKVLGIIPLKRAGFSVHEDPLAGCSDALRAGDLLLLFPEGSRGEPEQLSAFKTGVAHLAKRHPEAPVVPIFLHGLGKALPRGEGLLVPFICDVLVGEALSWSGDRQLFMKSLEATMNRLAEEGHFATWE